MQKRLGQGNEERLHPGMSTFGSEAVFLDTGQGIGTDDNAMHGYTVDTDLLPAPPAVADGEPSTGSGSAAGGRPGTEKEQR